MTDKEKLEAIKAYIKDCIKEAEGEIAYEYCTLMGFIERLPDDERFDYKHATIINKDFAPKGEQKVMTQYIDKSTVVAEIEKMLQEEYPCDNPEQTTGYHCALYELQDFLNTPEVKEVNLEQEIQQHINDCLDIKFPTTDIKMIAKDVEYTARKFFELGLKAQKGE